MTIEQLDITPDKSLMEKLGYVGFTPEQAFAEFVDNSLDAKYDEVTGMISIKDKIITNISIEKDQIKFRDNGTGIKNPAECLRPASSSKVGKLGNFGLGLKTASFSLGKKLIINSKYLGEDKGFSLILDLEDETWKSSKNWQVTITWFKADKEDHWTELIIEKLHTPFSVKDTDKIFDIAEIKKKLAIQFSPFIEDKELKISINGNEIIPESLEFISPKDFENTIKKLGFSKTEFPQSKKEFKFQIRMGGKDFEIFGWVDLLANWSHSGGRYGFNLYRGKRLIQPFQKVGMREHMNLSRIFGHIYLPNEFPVTFTKNRFEVARREWAELNERVNENIKDYLKLCEKWAQKSLKTPQIKPETIKKLDSFLESIENACKESEMIKKFLQGKEKVKSKDGTKKSEIDIEKRGPKVDSKFKKPIPKGEKVRQPKDKTQKKREFIIEIRGKKVKIKHDFQLIDAPPIKMYYRYFDEKKGEFSIITNTAFESWGLTKDEPFYGAMNIISALSEFFLSQKENFQYSLEDIKEELWRRVGKTAIKSI